MSSLSTTSIKRPVLAIVMNIIIILFGYIGFKYLGVREFPSIDPPIVNVRTSYPGANADVIESQITEPLEKAINSIDGIRTISSASNQGSSNITVEFNLSKDLDDAANDVRDKVSQAARSLPKDIDGLPVVSKADANSDAIISMTLQSNTRNQLEVSDYAENVLAERLQTIPGVSSVQIWGQKRYAMRLWIDPIRLASYGLTTLDVKNALDRENVQLPTGKITGDNTELTVNAAGNMSTEEEFNNLIIKNDGANIIRLSDVGHAVLGPENEETILRQSGIPMIGLALVPQPGANYIDISNEFYKRYEQIKKDLPKDYKTDIALDNTLFVKKSINEVAETLGVALTLVVLIIYIFFRNWGIAFRPLIDIPVSLIGTFFIMYLMGFSINVLTLLAIVLATGLVVDDGIVVTENIYKKVEEGLSPFEAAIKGSNEIFFAIISTSITLAAVFLPIIFLEGFVGRLFREFGIVISAAVLISAFVSLTLTPMLNAKLIRKNQKQSRFYEMTEPLFVNMVESYRASLNKFLAMRWVAFPLVGVCVGMIFFFGKMLQSELAPLDDRNFISLSVTAPEGASFDYTDNFLKKITQTVIDSIPEKQVLLTVTAPGFGNSATNTGFGRLRLVDPDHRTRSQQQIADYLTKLTSGLSEARTFVIQQQTISAGGGRGLPVQYVLQAPNFEKLKEILPKFMEEVQKDPTFTMTDVNLKFNKPELNITIDRDKAKALGVSFVDVAQTLQLGLSGQRFGYYIMNGKQYQVIGQFDRSDREDPSNLTSIFVRNNQNQLIQMDNLIKMDENSSPPQLYHFNRFTAATVSAGLAPGKTIGDGIAAMDAIKEKVLNDSFQTSLSGASRDFAESSSNIMFAFVLALVLIYLILAAQFESFIDPFIIMITVPLAIAGAVFSLWLFNQTINIFSQIGIIMLVGLVTKNGILIVEFANQLKERGVPLQQAIRDSAAARLRPILMTSLATALGALPIAMALGDAAKSRMSMGIVVIGGILFSLALTLFVIPAIYSYFSREQKVNPEEHTPENTKTEPKLITAEA
ncbi:acriflavin resistance protein [Solitalea longa]|uniref:Acriflavin resistance protein n=1 Tax=Solitalea longa TaxID=2079460 RepID=A0A2S5A0W9_9SPHI|nr:efflux RND transporter permease subunit [Solitalea longa]POY35773.1 acriflavin resistance protein [Solitalea longa]